MSTPKPPELDARRLLQDGARGEALDLGQEGLDAAAAVGAGQVKAAQGGGRGVTPFIRQAVSGFRDDRPCPPPLMCNRFVPPPTLDTLDDEIRQLGLVLAFPAGRPNLPPEYAIGDSPPVVLRAGEGLSLAPMTWAWKGPGGKPVFNFRSDGRTFGASERCLIPAAGFFEFTDAEPGHKRKTKWRFDRVDAPWMWMAGVVRQGAFAILTTEPGPDVAPYHDRQVCVLAPGQALEWLDLTQAEGALLRPLPAGSLSVRKVYPERA